MKDPYFQYRVHFMNCASRSLPLVLLICLLAKTDSYAQSRLAGFVASPYWNEQVKTIEFSPEVRIQINAPAEEKFIPTRPTFLILYALPNGNTIEQTAGRRMSDGLDWHFNIQHIGAQTRRLREIMPGENIVIVYLEARGKSWPQWRRKFANSNELIARIVDTVRNELRSFNPKVILTGHSGGGSFVFGFLNGVETIPEYVTRISFLDSNYGYDDSSRHGDKLIEWLHRNPNHVLSAIAYDDRNIVLNGKRVVGPDGGDVSCNTSDARSFPKGNSLYVSARFCNSTLRRAEQSNRVPHPQESRYTDPSYNPCREKWIPSCNDRGIAAGKRCWNIFWSECLRKVDSAVRTNSAVSLFNL